MSDLAFGLIMMVTGMSVTFLTLYLLTIVIHLLNRLFPFKQIEKDKSPSARAPTVN